MTVDFYATREWYVDHLAPIWQALPVQDRGTFYLAPLNTLTATARNYGISPEIRQPRRDRLTVVAGGAELPGLRHAVLVEHGAGQTYLDVEHESWAGGPGREHVRLFVVPNETVEKANRTRYPDARYLTAAPRVERLRQIPRARTPLIVFGRHWDSYLSPELQSAWPHYFDAIASFCQTFPAVTALHFHPRAADRGRILAAEWGIPYIDTFDDVIRCVGLYVIDNSSTGYEAAACGIPVLWYNSPDWRRNVAHGLRFWDLPDDVQADSPGDLANRCLSWLDTMTAPFTDVSAVFPEIEGSAIRAAAAIIDASRA